MPDPSSLADPDDLDAILARVSDGVTVQDAGGRVVYANVAALPALGFDSVEELLATPLAELHARFELFDEEGNPFPRDALPSRLAMQGKPAPRAIVRFRVRATGEERWAEVHAAAITDAEGSVRRVVNTFHDITESKRNELALRFLTSAGTLLSSSLNYEETLERVAQLAVPALADWCVVDLLTEDGEVRRVAAWHADPAKRALATNFTRRYPPNLDEGGALAEVLRTGQSQLTPEITEAMLEAAMATHPERWGMLRELGLRSSIIVPLAVGERITGAVTLIAAESGRHFSDRDLAVAELLGRRAGLAVENSRLYRDAQDAVAARDTFLSMAAHELLTPVTVVRGYSQTLQRLVARREEEPPPEGEPVVLIEARRLSGAAHQLESAAGRLTRLISDLLDVTRLTRRRLELSPAPMSLSESLHHAVDDAIVQQTEGRYDPSVTIEVTVTPPGIEVIGEWDAVRLEQVILNLLDNALKYSAPDQRIGLKMELLDQRVRVTVRDAGLGIPPDQLDAVFEPFSRGSNVADRGLPGFGMGLAICRAIVEGHGGRIWAESGGADRGTTMIFELPGARSSRAPLATP